MHNLSAESLLSVSDVQQRFLNLTGQNSSISPACTTYNNCSDYCFSIMLTLIIVCCPTAWNCALYISSLVSSQRLKGTHMQISGVFFLLNSLFENSSHFCLNNLFSSVRLLWSPWERPPYPHGLETVSKNKDAMIAVFL